MDDNVSGRYSGQVLFKPIGVDGQARLRDSRVVIIGCGALGTGIADRLARSGTGHIKIIDRDFVEFDNLQRQSLFNEEHARERLPKAVAAERVLSSINSEIKIKGVVGDVTPANIEDLLGGCDLVMDATDNLETRFLMNDACVKLEIPWVHGAVGGSCGQEMLIVPGATACFRCYLPELPQVTLPGVDVLGVLNTITGLTAELQTTHAIQVLTGDAARGGVLTYVDIWEKEFLQFDVERLLECPACAKGEYSFLDSENIS
ncbi:MAG: thiamine biosynthesis protein ThiF [Candidatus Anoxymicrobium japonicum]|uniref:Thiamine biosynthesis protein ThiF n=1 Tax=Candidatus Anoxymicrobium japonicum TaxID=2013648 RepID=A0A2N3G5B8_9ACTN|nr:MAG: thiamine biosynthesis protein ThiF [Candidatus Anoxymicrobium japonicum]